MNPYRILIVDDESDFRTLLVEALDGMGYACEGAATAEEAIELARVQHYAVIFTDLNMPGGKSGLELIQAVHSIDPKTFSILMTGYATTDAAIQALKNGAYDFIQKPFKLAEVDASLVRALDHYKALRENEAYQSRLEERVKERTRELEEQKHEVMRLKDEIENLFDGFVKASVTAIETRDPTTSGHSERVAKLTVSLAEAVNDTPNGRYGPVRFSAQQLKELRYASLLHDFGKVGVREEVLTKARKLAPERLERILQRLHQRDLERVVEAMQAAWRRGDAYDPAFASITLAGLRSETQKLVDLVLRCNEPKILPQEVAEALDDLEPLPFSHWGGRQDRIFETGDLAALRIPKGSLSEEERIEINNHVSHTYKFLKMIPWNQELAQVPEIAYAHHERLNGMGYPRALPTPEIVIPTQSKLMAICDVFDALVAADRPYKVAVTVPRSLEILQAEVTAGLLDGDAYGIFLEARIFELTTGQEAAGVRA